MVSIVGLNAGTCNHSTVHAWRPQSGTRGLWRCDRAPTALLKASSGKMTGAAGRGGTVSSGVWGVTK